MEDVNKKDCEAGLVVKVLECNRCWHTWIPRKTGDPPVSCPKCHSCYFNRPRIKPIRPKNS